MEKIIRILGAWALSKLRTMGKMILFLSESLYLVFVPPFKFHYFFRQIRFFGTKSLIVILLTGAFTGMVLAIQLYYTLRKFGSDALLGLRLLLA